MKVNRLLAGTLVIVLVSGFTFPVFAQELAYPPQDFISSESVIFPPLHGDIDQSYPGPFGTRLVIIDPTGQTFIPTKENLVSVDIFLTNFFDGNPVLVTVTIWKDEIGGSGTMLGSESQLIPQVMSDVPFGQLIHFDFVSSIALVPGNTYVIQVEQDGTFNLAGCVICNPYPDGLFIQDGTAFAQAEVGFVTYFEEPIDTPVGGEIIPLDTTSLLLAGAQSFSWMIPVVLSVLGIGLFVVSRKSENS